MLVDGRLLWILKFSVDRAGKHILLSRKTKGLWVPVNGFLLYFKIKYNIWGVLLNFFGLILISLFSYRIREDLGFQRLPNCLFALSWYLYKVVSKIVPIFALTI